MGDASCAESPFSSVENLVQVNTEEELEAALETYRAMSLSPSARPEIYRDSDTSGTGQGFGSQYGDDGLDESFDMVAHTSAATGRSKVASKEKITSPGVTKHTQGQKTPAGSRQLPNGVRRSPRLAETYSRGKETEADSIARSAGAGESSSGALASTPHDTRRGRRVAETVELYTPEDSGAGRAEVDDANASFSTAFAGESTVKKSLDYNQDTSEGIIAEILGEDSGLDKSSNFQEAEEKFASMRLSQEGDLVNDSSGDGASLQGRKCLSNLLEESDVDANQKRIPLHVGRSSDKENGADQSHVDSSGTGSAVGGNDAVDVSRSRGEKSTSGGKGLPPPSPAVASGQNGNASFSPPKTIDSTGSPFKPKPGGMATSSTVGLSSAGRDVDNVGNEGGAGDEEMGEGFNAAATLELPVSRFVDQPATSTTDVDSSDDSGLNLPASRFLGEGAPDEESPEKSGVPESTLQPATSRDNVDASLASNDQAPHVVAMEADSDDDNDGHDDEEGEEALHSGVVEEEDDAMEGGMYYETADDLHETHQMAEDEYYARAAELVSSRAEYEQAYADEDRQYVLDGERSNGSFITTREAAVTGRRSIDANEASIRSGRTTDRTSSSTSVPRFTTTLAAGETRGRSSRGRAESPRFVTSSTPTPSSSRRQTVGFGRSIPADVGGAPRSLSRGRSRPMDTAGVAEVTKGRAAAIAPVSASSQLLAPTAASLGRSRSRSSSPAVTAARGRKVSMSDRAAGGGLPLSPRGGGRSTGSGYASQRQPRAQSTGRRALTMPATPNFHATSRGRAEMSHETTEEAEYRRQLEMQEELKQMTRRNQMAMERSRRAAYSGNVRSNKPLTVPESPAMKTVGRLGGKVYAAVGSQIDHVGFSPTHPARDDAGRRGNPSHGNTSSRGPTIPAPFHLSQTNRVVREASPGRSRSAAGGREASMTFRERMTRIENKTPERFRSRPLSYVADPVPPSHVETKPTLPKSPRFRTEARAATKPKTWGLSREEREEAELAEMKKHQFRARPFPGDGYGVGGEKGVFRPQHSDKQLTQPAPFRLSTDGRAAARAPSPHRSRDEEELSKQFKARPMPSARSSSVGRVRPGAKVTSSSEFRARELTVAASPMLTTKRRSAVRTGSLGGVQSSEEAELQEAAKQFRARPMPDYQLSASQTRRQTTAGDQSTVLTEPRPFHLSTEERGKAKQALLAQRLLKQRQQEEASGRVRARPLPRPSHGFMPEPSDKPLTETAEFRLSSQARHERAAEQFRQKVREEAENLRRAAEVTALPLPAATFEPEVIPSRSEMSLTQPMEVKLHSSARAEGRAQWEQENQARLEAEEYQRLLEAEAREEAEQAAIAEMRRRSHFDGGMSFKAQPITYSSGGHEAAHVSTLPLTTPITPNLRTTRRAINAVAREQAPIA